MPSVCLSFFLLHFVCWIEGYDIYVGGVSIWRETSKFSIFLSTCGFYLFRWKEKFSHEKVQGWIYTAVPISASSACQKTRTGRRQGRSVAESEWGAMVR